MASAWFGLVVLMFLLSLSWTGAAPFDAEDGSETAVSGLVASTVNVAAITAADLATTTPTPAFVPAASTSGPAGPQNVKVGFYLLNGGKLDFVNSCLALDFYLWFTFSGSDTPSFEFLNTKNAVISKLEEKLPYPGTDTNYVVFRVNGTFDQAFDLRNFPFDRFVIRILLEDTEATVEDRVYLVDEAGSGMDEMFQVLGWNIDQFRVKTLVHPYGTTFGTPGKVKKESYSQAEVSLSISRNHVVIFIKMVMPAVLFLLIAVLSILLPIEQISQRISLCVAALFSSVAYHLSLAQGLPQISYLTFVDKMMLGNYFTIFVTLILTVLIFLADKATWVTTCRRLTLGSRILVPLLAFLLIARLISMGA